MESLLARLIADLDALRDGGMSSSRSAVYRAFLELGTIGDARDRDTAIEAVLVEADASGESHLAILIRLAALPLLTGRQREIVDELLALLAT